MKDIKLGSLHGKVALVTGATSGVGRATALALSAAGASVVATGVEEADVETLLSELKASGSNALYLHLDVTSENSWAQAVATVSAQFEHLDVVVNNAGVFVWRSLADTTDEDWMLMQRVNVEGVWLGMKYGFEAMAPSGRGGSIINVSSLQGLVGEVNTAAYCATKGAVTHMTKSAALEGATLSPPIRVNSVHPGVIWTRMITDLTGDELDIKEKFIQGTPLRMIGLPGYIADAITFLASDEASYVTGAEFVVDGGRGAD